MRGLLISDILRDLKKSCFFETSLLSRISKVGRDWRKAHDRGAEVGDLRESIPPGVQELSEGIPAAWAPFLVNRSRG